MISAKDLNKLMTPDVQKVAKLVDKFDIERLSPMFQQIALTGVSSTTVSTGVFYQKDSGHLDDDFASLKVNERSLLHELVFQMLTKKLEPLGYTVQKTITFLTYTFQWPETKV